MTIEEKAQAYDGAFKVAENIHRFSSDLAEIKRIEQIFPKLKESEDEKMRKTLIAFLKKFSEAASLEPAEIDLKKYIAWLEKQGEQKPIDKIQLGQKYKCIASPRYTTFIIDKIYKPEDKFLCSLMNFCCDCFEPIEDDGQKSVDKVEPKFHEGDWLVHNERRNIIKVVNATPLVYKVVDVLGYHHTITDTAIENNYHLWTIQDAKDGDVLVHNSIIFIFMGIENGIVKGICTELSDTILNFGEPEYDNDYCPATKEQRDLLFQKMKEARYEWDAEKKELRKIEEDLTEFENALADVCRGWIGEELGWKDYIIKNSLPLLKLAKEQFDKYEQKHVSWSEEDERIILAISQLLKDCESENGWNCVYSNDREVFFADIENYLQSLKNRIVSYPKQEI